jgi:hypothetical protein
MRMRFALVLVLLGVMLTANLAQAETPRQWFLNGNGTNETYQIFEFTDSGLPRSVTPVASPVEPLQHVAWPSAIQVGDERWLLASGFDGTSWETIYRWVSTDNETFSAEGPWFSADASEPFGIGPAHVMFDPDAEESFIVIYLVRGESGPGSTIAVATSADGQAWTRSGAVISQSLPQEAGGLTMSYACQMQDGDWALFYSGYSEDLTHAAALVATGPSLFEPMTRKAVLFEGDDATTSLSANQAENTATVGIALQIGLPHLIIDPAGNELVVPIAQDGSRVWFDRPLLFDHQEAVIASMAASKVDPSYAQQQPDGSWRGIVTVYGPQPGVFAEYTTEVSAPALDGEWTFDNTGVRFSPWMASTLYSAENPTPLSQGTSCAN